MILNFCSQRSSSALQWKSRDTKREDQWQNLKHSDQKVCTYSSAFISRCPVEILQDNEYSTSRAVQAILKEYKEGADPELGVAN